MSVPSKKITGKDADYLAAPADAFARDAGVFARHRDNYEYRPEQEAMARAVHEALRENKHLLVEAGTGVGKSLAYLLPIVAYALRENVRVAISTETRALQKQILEQEIPLCEKILKKKVPAEICLGASNYICKRKLGRVVQDGSFDLEMQDHLPEFLAWEAATESGTRLDYDGFATPTFWNQVTREPDNCLAKQCPNFDVSFFFVARRKWREAKVLIVNHSLLCSHLALERKLLPEFEHVVIDEGHRFPASLMEAFQKTVTTTEISTLIRQCPDTPRKDLDQFERWHEKMSEPLALRPGQNLRLREAFDFAKTQEYLDRMKSITSRLRLEIENSKASLFGEEEDEGQERDEHLLKLTMLLTRLDAARRVMGDILVGPDDGFVHWVTRPEKGRETNLRFTVSPLEIGSVSHSALLDEFSSVVFTSATLTSSGREPFDYFKRQLGIDPSDVEANKNPVFRELKLNSPFDFKQNAILYLPRNIPDPKEEEEFLEAAALLLSHLLTLSGGGAFVLFTSKASLRAVHERLTELREEGAGGFETDPDLEFFDQNRLGAPMALAGFQKARRGVLLGLATFWQGIDIPGDRLRLVVLVRLPFRVPDDPLLEARMDREREAGRSPFFNLQLPEAIIDLKQGFGRLIRSRRDRGAVCIIDPRPTTRAYGRDILAALPPARLVRSFSELRRAYGDLFAKTAAGSTSGDE